MSLERIPIISKRLFLQLKKAPTVEKLFEMIKDFAELTNSYNKADAKSLATQIKERIINA